MVQNWIATLKEKSGKSLDEWIKLLQKDGPAEEKDRRGWLKEKHGFGTNAAWWISERSVGKNTEDGDPDAYLKQAAIYVEEMYAGSKAGLRPLHDRLIELARDLADDVKICPCQTIVPFYREHVFAQIKPSTNTRIDFGLALAKFTGKIPARLNDTGGKEKKDRITHRFVITRPKDINTEVERWLKVAYDLDG
jgi:hypothetical protein